ncbi:MAG: hypothetical protein RL404_2783, partial [Pseudomonadota bacterium]
QSVIFSCSLGCPTVVEREQVYALLLNANLLLTGISGARMALSQPDDEVMLIGEYPMRSPSTEAMRQMLHEFLSLALKYADLIASPSCLGFAEPMPALPGDAVAGAQRV